MWSNVYSMIFLEISIFRWVCKEVEQNKYLNIVLLFNFHFIFFYLLIKEKILFLFFIFILTIIRVLFIICLLLFCFALLTNCPDVVNKYRVRQTPVLFWKMLKKNYIHTYIIRHYNPSVWIIDLVSHAIYVACVN